MAKRLFAISLGILWIAAGSIAPLAQEIKQPAQESTKLQGINKLQTTLERLERELTLERESLEKDQKSYQKKLTQAKSSRHELAQRLLEKKIELEKLKKQREGLEAQKKAVASGEAESILKEFLANTRSSAERLDILLHEIPADEQGIVRLHELLKNSPTEPDFSDTQRIGQSFSVFMDMLERVHEEATTIRVNRRKIRTAGGLLEEVKLLSVGYVSFAYETQDGGRIGLALSSPRDASGYRWTEKLTEPTVREVRRAISQCESGDAGCSSLPMDVTGRLRVDTLLQKETWVEWFKAGGPVMFPLALVAILVILVTGERIWWLYLRNAEKEALTRKILAACGEKRYEEAENLLAKADGAVLRTLAACLRRRNQGVHAMEDGIQEQFLHELPLLRRFLSGLAILAAVAPLLGLLGTVTGMIRTFNVIHAFGNANPGLMAGGISEALITTEAGLVIAIPTVLLCGLLRGRLEKIIGDAERHAATLLNMLSQGR